MKLTDIKRNSNNFSFTNTLGSLIGNREFKQSYNDFFENKNSEKTFIWTALSAIGDELGEVIYENVLNYIDNIANINTCKVKALASMSKILGVINYGILKNIDTLPLEVLNLLDILSINKNYLLHSRITSPELKKIIYDYSLDYSSENALSTSILSDDLHLFNIDNKINKDNYRYFIYDSFYKLLKDNVLMTYGDSNTELSYDYIYKNISADILLNDITYWNKDYRDKINNIKSINNISPNFNQSKIASDIYVGNDSLDNYSGVERELITLELQERTKTKNTRIPLSDNKINSIYKDSDKIYTRYSYYKEQKVKEYFRFIENSYISNSGNLYINAETTGLDRYDLDNNYSVLSGESQTGSLINSINEYFNTDNVYRIKMISDVAKVLTDLAFAIIDLRERLKTQSQRNYMTGTELLLTYVINEYLKKNLPLQYPILSSLSEKEEFRKGEPSQSKFGSEVIEYHDTTEYFNINTDTTKKAYNKHATNAKYWDSKDNYSSVTGNLIGKKTVDDFYKNTLGLKYSTENAEISTSLDSFLNTVYSLGANSAYLSDDNISSMVLPYEGAKLSSYSDEDMKLLSAEQNQIFLKFHGNKLAFLPYYNHKNITHPSYMVHPYMYNFVEYSNIYFAINNAFNNNANENLINILMTPKLSTVIGNFGNILNIWDNNTMDYSGYRSRYEDSTHSLAGALGYGRAVTNYDGTFYPPAVEEYMLSAANEDSFKKLIDSVSNEEYYDDKEKHTPSFFSKYYSHLSLPSKVFKNIATQLSVYKDDIIELAKPRDKKQKQYDIYKYCLDNYFNSYTLYKKYPLDTLYDARKNTNGFIWFRYNNHPIGFPAFTGRFPQVSMTISDKLINTYLSSRIKLCEEYSKMPAAELSAKVSKYSNISTDRFFNRLTDANLSDSLYEDLSTASIFYDMDVSHNKQHMQFAVEDFTVSSARDYHNADIVLANTFENTLLSGITYNLLQPSYYLSYIEHNNTYKFNGFFHADRSVYDIFTSLNGDNLTVEVCEYPYDKEYIKYIHTFSLSNDFKIKDEIISSSVFNAGYYDSLFSIAVLTKVKSDLSAQTYLGYNYKDGKTNYFSNPALDISGEYNSADRFETHLGLLEFNEAFLIDNKASNYVYKIKTYNLDSDESYLPLYVGRYGQIYLWSSNRKFYAIPGVRSDSVELLGISYNDLPNEIQKFSKYLISDDNGNLHEIGTDDVLSAAIRVYENCDRSEYAYERTNRALRTCLSDELSVNSYYQHETKKGIDFTTFNDDIRLNQIDSDNEAEDLSVIIGSNKFDIRPYNFEPTYNVKEQYFHTRRRRFILNPVISSDTCLSDYMFVLYNSEAGAKYPIIAGELGYDFVSNDNNYTYMSADSKIDEYILSTGERPREFVNVVGTTPFADELSTIIDYTNTNHIINIKKITGCLSSFIDDEGRKRYYFEFRLWQNKFNTFVINTGQLTLFVYLKNALGQFTDYHYLEPFDTYPFNALYNLSDYLPSALISAQHIVSSRIGDPISGEFHFDRVHFGTTNAYMESVELHGLSAFEQVPSLSTGQITFKTSEEDFLGDAEFPPFLIDELIYDKFNSTNKSSKRFIKKTFDLSNTYILQIESPKDVARYLSVIGIDIYNVNQECARAFEDFISSQYYIDEYGPEVLGYEHFFHLSAEDIPFTSLSTPSEWFNIEIIPGTNTAYISGVKPKHKIIKKEHLDSLYAIPYDVIIWVDSSGSMTEEINSIRGQVKEILDTLQECNPKSRISIVTAKDHANGDVEYINYKSTTVVCPFTNDIDQLTKDLGNLNATSPGGKAGYWGEDPTIILSALNDNELSARFGFNTRNKKLVLLITDETAFNYPDNPAGPYQKLSANCDEIIEKCHEYDATLVYVYTRTANPNDPQNTAKSREYYRIISTDIIVSCDNDSRCISCEPEDTAESIKTIFKESVSNAIKFTYADSDDHTVIYDIDTDTPYIPEFHMQIPDEIDGYTIVGINEGAFKHNVAIRQYIASPYVNYVGKDVFDISCDEIQYIEFNNSDITQKYINEQESLSSIENVPGLCVVYNSGGLLPEDYPPAFDPLKYDLYPTQDLSTINDCCELFEKYGYYRKFDEVASTNLVTRIHRYEVLSSTIDSFLKLYVNYTQSDEEGIILYFNYANFFNSQFVEMTEAGVFQPVIYPNTYARLAPGECKSLDIILQFKYFDDIGVFCGCKTIPVISYKIWNVSDDKPKFVILKKWELKSAAHGGFGDITNTSPAFIKVNSKIVPAREVGDIVNKYTDSTITDVTGKTTITVGSEIPLSKFKCRFLYETGENNEFTILKSRDMTSFNDNNGVVDIEFSKLTIDLPFRLNEGIYVGKETFIKFPIKILEASAVDENGNTVNDISFEHGFVQFNFEEVMSRNTYLAKEHKYFDGFIFTEQTASLIKMFDNPMQLTAVVATTGLSGETSETMLSTLEDNKTLLTNTNSAIEVSLL